MARPDPQPTPLSLRLATGTFRPSRHGSAKLARKAFDGRRSVYGPLERPRYLKGEAAKAWDRQVALVAPCLHGGYEPLAVVYRQLVALMLEAPRAFTAAQHRELRACASALGLNGRRCRL
jgi:hypothetical protein